MILDPAIIISLLQVHGYWIMFVLTFLEGSMIIYISAFAASLGILNLPAVIIIGIVGNLVGDIFYYGLGRLGRAAFVHRIIHKLVSEERMKRIERYLHDAPGRTLLVIKLTPPLAIPGLIISGISAMPFWKFIVYAVVIGVVQGVVLALLGFYSGVAFGAIAHSFRFTEILIGIAIVLFVVVWFILRNLQRRVSQKIEKI
jgi:membrane protein DedA with SNARE-associated domain